MTDDAPNDFSTSAGFTGVFPADERAAGSDARGPIPMVVGQFHGILTGRSARAWPTFGTRFFKSRYPHVRTVNSEYFALPLPRIEAVRNTRRSRNLGRAMLSAAEASGADCGCRPEVAFVSHSNGAVLAMQVARGLIAKGIPIRAMVLISPALRTRPASSEIGSWLDSGMLGSAVLVRPTRDIVIGSIARNWRTKIYAWPWGSLGHDGWDVFEMSHFPNPPRTIDVPNMGHSDPVDPAVRPWLYSEIVAPALFGNAENENSETMKLEGISA